MSKGTVTLPEMGGAGVDPSAGPGLAAPLAPTIPDFLRPGVPARPGAGEGVREGLDLMAIGWIRSLVLSRWFPSAIQASLLVMLVSIVALGWGRLTPTGANTALFAKLDPVTLLTWGLWWPGLIILTVLLGRGWCTICPLALTSGWGERLAQRMGFRQRRLPKWLRAGALCLGLYATVQLLNAGLHFNKVPAYTAVFFAVLIVLPVIVGFFLRDKAFCRGVCPVSMLLKTYGRGGMVAVRCKTDSRYDGERCPSLLNPARLASSMECGGCCHCIKTSKSQSMRLLLRRPFARSDARIALAGWTVTLFAMLDSGFVTHEIVEEWPAAEAVFLWTPEWIVGLLGLQSVAGWIEGIWVIGVFPLLLWAGLGAMVRAAKGAPTLTEAWRRLALPMLAISAAGHMSKCLEKLSSWGAYLPQALASPTGAGRGAGLLSDGSLIPPAPILSMDALSVIATLVLVVMAGVALRESRLAHPAGHRSRIAPLACASLAAIFIVLHW